MNKKNDKYIILLRENGFSFISLLIALVIMGILAATALTYYKQLGLFGKDRTNPKSVTRKLDLDLTKNTLRQINDMELSYFTRFNRYGTFEDLQRENMIPAGYTATLQSKGKPFLNYWDIEIRAKEESYLLIASPNALASDFEGVPILGMNETGKIWEEEGYDSSLDEESSDDESASDDSSTDDTSSDEPPPDDTVPQ